MRTYSHSAVTIILAFIAGFIGGELAESPKSIQANTSIKTQAIEIVDQAGRIRGRFAADDLSGRVTMCLAGSDQRCAIELTSIDSASAIVLRQSNGDVVISLGSVNGRPTLNMRDGATQSNVVLGYNPSDLPTGDEYSWGLRFPRGAFGTWASIGTSKDPKTKRVAGYVSITDETGRHWSLPRSR